jgi:transposase-like protein
VRAFEAAYGAKFPKAVAKITDDVEELLAFYDYPAEHWIHLRTTDEIVNPLLGRAGFVYVGAVFPPFVAAA